MSPRDRPDRDLSVLGIVTMQAYGAERFRQMLVETLGMDASSVKGAEEEGRLWAHLVPNPHDPLG